MPMNLCRACGQDFSSVRTFDDHRVGKHAYLWSPAREDGRRCLDPAEMRGLGLTLNALNGESRALEVRAQVIEDGEVAGS